MFWPEWRLMRVVGNPEGMFGVMVHRDTPICLTLERPWLGNQQNISCIPKGDYLCRRVLSPKFGDTFEVTHVPGRSAILFHKGNLMDDTHGCIVLGEQYGFLEGKTAVLSSGPAFVEFMERNSEIDEFKFSIL